MLLKILVLVFVLLLLAFAGLSVRVILRRGGRFPNTHVSGNSAMRGRGITCAQSQDAAARMKNKNSIDVNKL